MKSIKVTCYDWFSSLVRRWNRDGLEVRGILTMAHQGFGDCTHCCMGKLKRRDQD